MKLRLAGSAALLFAFGLAAPASGQARSAAECAALASTKRPGVTISVAEAVAQGSFTPAGANNPIGNLPPFCRVAGTIAPTAESDIRFEVWLPLDGWNGKFAGVGNGGWAGVISFGPLAEQLRRGYATASTNTGHQAAGGFNAAKFAFDQPEQLVDFAYRAHHETALTAKALVAAFYGKPQARAYFIGCSSGGYEGLMAAQRFPDDYDGIVAGMPANNWTRLMAGDLDATLAANQGGVNHFTPAALGLLHRGALAACDAKDGVGDGILEDPRACTFDPGSLACKAGESGDRCLSPAQVTAARRIYDGLKDPKSGAQLYPGLARGSEPFWVHRDIASPFPIPIAHYKWLVFADPAWDWTTFDFGDPTDYEAYLKAEQKFAPLMNATDPNLEAFRKRGGKLVQYHGWNDQLITPLNSIDYYESVLAHFGRGRDRAATLADVQSFYRLFMAPGVAHCGGGTGPNVFDAQTALEQWVEAGVAPDQLPARRLVNGVVDRSRPLCVYPAVAVYRGSGDTNDAASFECRVPAR